MFKKSMVVISIIILSCVCYVSCKSRSSGDSSSSLASLKVNAPDEIKDYVTGVRVVAVSSVSSCTDAQKLITLGKSDSVDEESFKNESNFVSLTENNASQISLYASCFPYDVTLAYTCKETTVKNQKYEKGLCFKGTKPAKKEDITDKTIKLEISLQGQGTWAKLGKVEVISEVPVTLAKFFDSKCFVKNGEAYEFYLINDKLYPLFSKDCTYQSTQNTTFSSEMGEGHFQSPFADESQFDNDTKLITRGNNIVEILEINGKAQNISSMDELHQALSTDITSGFKINIIFIPNKFSENDIFTKQNVIYKKK